MKFYKKQMFERLFNDGEKAKFENMTFDECKFRNCGLSLTRSVKSMARVSNVELRNCSCFHCTIGPVVLDSVSVINLAISEYLYVFSPLFRHVTLKGNIGGRLLINKYASFDVDEKFAKSFTHAQRLFYKDVDWALDISEASFREFVLYGVPARLIRRDPDTQVVVTRERALQPGWRDKLSPSNDIWPIAIDLFLENDEPDCVLAARKGERKKEFIRDLDGLKELRQLGVVEPD